ncbi:MAG: hypothetical protein KAS22_13810, partial [Candidatus Heimdallarchaeota archaeon]|nr:hypothetical protein [Candidatus Heimdallarchaeota archaeon]
LQKNVKAITKFSITELQKALKEFEAVLSTITKDTTQIYTSVISNYKKASRELFDQEKGKLEAATANMIDQVGKNIDKLAAESTSLKENIDEIAKAGLLKRPDPKIVQEAKEQADRIDSLSQKIKSSYDGVMKVYQKEIIDGMNQLIKNNDSMLTKQLKEGTTQLKTIKSNLNTKWTAIARKFEQDINSAVKDVLKETSPKIISTAKEAVTNALKHVEGLKEGISHILAPLRDVVFTDLEDTLENHFLNSSKRLRMHNESNNKALETIRYLSDDMKFAFKTQVQEELSKPKLIASEMISEYTSTLDNYLTTLNRDQSASLDLISKAGETFLLTIKDSFSTSSNEISSRLAGIIYKVNE